MCRGSASFRVIVGHAVLVSVLLQCVRPPTTGGATINGSFNTCPVIDWITFAPVATAVTRPIELRAAAHDDDCTMRSGATCTAYQPVTMRWMASVGNVTGIGGTASYTCPSGGPHTLTLTVSDGLCPVTVDVQVNCFYYESCGNGFIDAEAGEECDGPSVPNPGQLCSPNCRLIPQCGNGYREGTEQCDPPHPVLCSNTCRFIEPCPCGDGIRCGSEQCDDGNANPDDGCNNQCQLVDLCEQCERTAYERDQVAACNPDIAGCTRLAGDDRSLCEGAVACLRQSGCVINFNGDPGPCYCGTATDAACLGGMGNGPCRASFESAARSTNPEVVVASVGDPTVPLGRAVNLFRCDAQACQTACTF